VTYQGQADRDIQVANSSSLAEYWRPFLIEGAILIILGILAIAVPAVATLAIDIYLGWLFLIAGIAGFFAVFSVQDMASFLLSLPCDSLDYYRGLLL
jgi:uncharacterized membrane protein HdeD (DUF308 family)